MNNIKFDEHNKKDQTFTNNDDELKKPTEHFVVKKEILCCPHITITSVFTSNFNDNET